MNKVINGSALGNKGAKGILFATALLLTSAVFLSSESIRAQMANLYSESSDQVAGISSLMTATTNGDIDGVKFFSKAGSAMVNQKNAGGATALHIAAREKKLEIAKILVENGADVNAADNEGWTPLMRASLAGDAEFVNLLLDKGADASAFNSANESAISHATSSDCAACLSAMFEKFNFIKAMDSDSLQQQINDSYVVARNHENAESQKVLGDYLDRSAKMAALSNSQNATDPSIAAPSVVVLNNDHLNNAAMPCCATSLKAKRFKLNNSGLGKIGDVEVVEPISIKNKDVANITSESPVKESDLGGKKVVYKFLGQSGESIAVTNYRNKVKASIGGDQQSSIASAATIQNQAPSAVGAVDDGSSKIRKVIYKLVEGNGFLPKEIDAKEVIAPKNISNDAKAGKIFKLKKDE
ncbi:MAG: ankyrin repeat domain-containing protein [Rickettsiales bacterium]|nr:ankyrin repeat domain-containing protein [Rickettsiales bacterium]